MKKVLAFIIFSFVLCLSTGSAFAHAHIDPDTAAKGSSGSFVISLPNERADSDTTKVQFVFDEAHPVGDASISNSDPWISTPEYNSDKSVIKSITLEGGKITGEDKEKFTLDIKNLPGDIDSTTIKVLQTYSDGEIVRWIDEPLANGEEAEHPALTLKLSGDAVTTTAANDQILQNTVKEKVSKPEKTENSKTLVYVILGAGALFVAVLGIKFYKNTK